MQKKKKNYLKVESNCFLVARARKKKKKKSIYYNLCTKEAVEGNDDDGEEG